MKEGWYCVTDNWFYGDERCSCQIESCDGCRHCRRKHETPEQFKERTGRDVPDGMAVYHRNYSVVNSFDSLKDAMSGKKGTVRCMQNAYWSVSVMGACRGYRDSEIILANTDFGPPEGDFEEEWK